MTQSTHKTWASDGITAYKLHRYLYVSTAVSDMFISRVTKMFATNVEPQSAYEDRGRTAFLMQNAKAMQTAENKNR